LSGKTKKSNNTALQNHEPAYRIIFTTVLSVVIFLTLFMARLHLEQLSGKSADIFASSNGMYADWFLYCKEISFFVCAIFIILYYIGEKIFPEKPCRNNPINNSGKLIPLFSVYFAFSLLSALFSDNKEVVMWGLCTEYEGLAAIFSYCILFFAGYNFFSGKKAQKNYRLLFFILIITTSLLAIFEFLYKPLLELPFMKYLIADAEHRDIAANLEFSDTFRETLLMFYNSNYMGGFCTIIFPVSVYYFAVQKKLIKKALCGIICCMAFTAAIMSNSTAAFYVVILEIIVLAVMLIIKKAVSIKDAGILAATVLVLFCGLNFASDNMLAEHFLKSASNSGTYSDEGIKYRLQKIQIADNSIYISDGKSEYYITPPMNSGEQLIVRGGKNTMFTEKSVSPNAAVIHDMQSDTDFSATVDTGVVYIDLGYKGTFDFAVTTKGVKAIVQNANLIDDIPYSKYNDTKLADFYSLATGRGYIWINTLPMLKKCIMLGKGAGNFPFYFVQNEMVGLSNTHGSYHIIIDKPHSWYLQIAVTGGMPALIAVLAIFAGFAFKGGKKLLRIKKEDYAENSDNLFFLCMFTGLIGFMITGIVNDSVVAVNPFFWFNLGITYCWINNNGMREKK